MGRPKKYHTEEELKLATRLSNKKWEQSEKGRIAKRRANSKYNKTEKGIAYNTKYTKEYHKEYNKTEKAKASKKKYPHMIRWYQLLHDSLKRLNQPKNDNTINLLKYSAIQLNEHLLSYGYNKDIHDIDHRIPVSWFRNDTPPHIVNHLSNLHPLNKKDNIIKGNRFAHSIEEAYYYEVFPFIKNTYQQRIYIDE